MGRFRLVGSQHRDLLRLALHGVFDGSSAWELRHALEGAEAWRIEVDFGGVVEAWEFGAAILTAGIKGADPSRITFVNVPESVRLALDLFGAPVELVVDREEKREAPSFSVDREEKREAPSFSFAPTAGA